MTLEATLEAAVDGDVAFAFRVVNAGTDPVSVTFRSGQTADLTVYDDTAEMVWRWSSDKMFTQAIETRTLGPGQALEETFTWESPPSGSYSAVATLEADVDVQARTTVSVP